jgi:hypothetical protein
MSLKENGPDPGRETKDELNDTASDVAEERLDYVLSEIKILAWGASTQHASLYKKHEPENLDDALKTLRSNFRNQIFDYLDEKVIPLYKSEVSEPKHRKNILALSKFGTKASKALKRVVPDKLPADQHADFRTVEFLREYGYKIGIAQKLLNLYLKYLWCLNQIPKPPHCPVDKIIIDKCKPARGVKGRLKKWTKITLMSEYDEIIEVIRDDADKADMSIAEWELSVYERR